MQQSMGYGQHPVFWINHHERPTILTHPPMHPLPPFPNLKRKQHKDGTCVCLLIIFLLVLLALTGVGLGTYKILELQKELNHVKEYSSDVEMSPSSQKLVGLNTYPEKKVGRQAAHVTAKESKNIPLVWEDRTGHAFTAGIQYKNRGLVVNETGLHFVYSSIYFRGTDCPKQDLTHIVYKKPLRYPAEMRLMENKEYQTCIPRVMWGRHSYLGAVFNLTSYDILYVNVSNANLISFDETKTFFGIYKL